MNAVLPAADHSLRDALEVARSLGTDPERGLSAAEAARRLANDGPNALRAAPPVPAWKRILAQFRDPLVYLLVVAIAISLAAWVVSVIFSIIGGLKANEGVAYRYPFAIRLIK